MDFGERECEIKGQMKPPNLFAPQRLQQGAKKDPKGFHKEPSSATSGGCGVSVGGGTGSVTCRGCGVTASIQEICS